MTDRMGPLLPSRRDLLRRGGGGFGLLGLAGALDAAGLLGAASAATKAEAGRTHFPARAKRVIVLFMNGGPSHVDTFDPKPALRKHEGEMPVEKSGKEAKLGYMPSPFAFRAHGRGGVVMSELFPHLARCADDLCVIRSMHTDVPNHEPALLLMHSGNQQPVRPSMGSWVSYGLGSANRNLPAFVVLASRRPVVGPQLWSSSFLPGTHQGMAVNTSDLRPEQLVANLRHPTLDRAQQKKQLELLQALNDLHRERRPEDAALEAQIQALETAFNMQREAAEAFDLRREPEALRATYGETTFGQSCLLARRLAERGVRFVQVYYLDDRSNQPWDTHQDNDKRHRGLCADSDRATAALLTDLKSRGMLDDTLVVWGGEFGRTPYAQPTKVGSKKAVGRDHQHTAFTTLLAGGGVKGGLTYGATDEFGMNVVEKPVHVHDLHATILYLLGLDHEKLTYRHSGRDFRLTDVYGKMVRDVIA
jgi:uncharacterized protein (DUF1501 family)